MTEQNQIYKCNVCGNIVEVLYAGAGELICCGQPMVLLEAKTEDVGQEKHVPVIEKVDSGIKVKVGSIPHPMEESHWIEWIELIINNKIFRQFLKPNQAPETVFEIKVGDIKTVQAREYCNLHGLWQSSLPAPGAN
ncbi:desulfoferrodoxin [Candidatus Microgenomates bacterium]|nr:desulfoferrodoxin [Candidatus Microgenomates bacterium]